MCTTSRKGEDNYVQVWIFSGFFSPFKLSNFFAFISMDSSKGFFLYQHWWPLCASFNFDCFCQYLLFFSCSFSLFLSFHAVLRPEKITSTTVNMHLMSGFDNYQKIAILYHIRVPNINSNTKKYVSGVIPLPIGLLKKFF